MDFGNLAKAAGNLDEETIAAYQRMEALLIDALRRTQAVLAILGRKTAPESTPVTTPTPLLDSITALLRERGEPTLQSDIIATVGGQRARLYPEKLRPFGDVLKSLQYHDKHNGEIVCVEWSGEQLKQGTMKQRPHAPRAIGGRKDCAEDYLTPDNLFWFRDRIEDMKRNP
jgi:hypothetical protein